MSAMLYHIDAYETLSVGDTMTLDWVPELGEGNYPTTTTANREVLEEMYPNGLTAHGARYAFTKLGIDENVNFPKGCELMVGERHVVNTETGEYVQQFSAPYIVQYEWLFEMVRRDEYPSERSRFQSYFGWESVKEAEEFIQKNRQGECTIYEVECESFEKRDMELLQTPTFGETFRNARTYWEGESGSENPTWEVVMEPPVEIVGEI